MGDSTDTPAFPDAPRSELDRVLAQLVSAAGEVQDTQGRLRSLLAASRLVASELELPVVLRRIAEAAVELVSARYAAIGVVAADGSLAEFVHVGMPDEVVSTIGHLPEGHGLLGSLIDEQRPIRLDHLRDDPRSSGFPAGHPPMESFVGVPVRVRGEVYGNLYVTESRRGSFTAEDEELLIALAGTAGAAIDHARLFDETQRRQRWSAATAEVTATLLSGHAEDSLDIIAGLVARLADADLVCVVVPAESGEMRIRVAHGDLAERFAGVELSLEGTVAGKAFTSGQPVLSDLPTASAIDPQLIFGPTMALPITAQGPDAGVITIARIAGRQAFTAGDLDMAADFSAQAGLALNLESARADQQRLAVLEDRARIARDLHDTVIQRLFAAGLSLQAASGSIADTAARAAVTAQVEALDTAISEIRTAIFALTATRPEGTSLRHRIIDLLSETSPLFAEPPRVNFVGAIDLLVGADLAEDVLAVIRESLSNAARHADASEVSVAIAVDGDELTVAVRDNGRGTADRGGRSSGTANLGARAAARGGSYSLANAAGGGAICSWRVPLAEEGQR